MHVIHGGAATWSAIGALERLVSCAGSSLMRSLGEEERLHAAGLILPPDALSPRDIRRSGSAVIAWDKRALAWCRRHSLEAIEAGQDIPIDTSRLAQGTAEKADEQFTVGWIDGDEEEGGRGNDDDLFVIITATALAGRPVRGVQLHGPPLRPGHFDALKASGVDATISRPGLPPWKLLPMCDVVAVAPGARVESPIVRDLLAWCGANGAPTLTVDSAKPQRLRRFHLAKQVMQCCFDPETRTRPSASLDATEFEQWLDTLLNGSRCV